MNKKNTIKTISENEKKIATFNGSSVRKWADAVRKSGKLAIAELISYLEPLRAVKHGQALFGVVILGVHLLLRPHLACDKVISRLFQLRIAYSAQTL